MSMHVDLNTPLTQQERDYLITRGRTAEVERVDSLHGVETPPFGDGDGTGPVSHGTASYDVRDERIAALERELELLKGGSDEDSDEQDDTEVAPYEEWTVKELDAELKRRKLPVKGNQGEKVTALYDHDEATSLSAQ